MEFLSGKCLAVYELIEYCVISYIQVMSVDSIVFQARQGQY